MALAYVLCILNASICVVYGIYNWNKGQSEVSPEDIHWLEEEKKVEDEL